jgi:hypothetical protein
MKQKMLQLESSSKSYLHQLTSAQGDLKVRTNLHRNQASLTRIRQIRDDDIARLRAKLQQQSSLVAMIHNLSEGNSLPQ